MAESPPSPHDVVHYDGSGGSPSGEGPWHETLRLLARAQHEDRLARRQAEQDVARLQSELDGLRETRDQEALCQASIVQSLQETIARAEFDRLQQLDEQRAVLAAREREALAAHHELSRQARRLEHEGAIYLAEIDRLESEVAAIRIGMPTDAVGASDRSRRFVHVRVHPLVEARLSRADSASASAETSMDAPLFQRTNYQPVFVPSENGEYLVTDFLALHDRNFVRAAYLAILRREPDPHGGQHFLEQVRAGEPKARLLGHLLNSEEGRKHRTQILGLKQHLRVLRLCELPILGRLVSAALLLANVNAHLRELRVLENHMIRIAEESQALHEANMSKLRSTSK